MSCVRAPGRRLNRLRICNWVRPNSLIFNFAHGVICLVNSPGVLQRSGVYTNRGCVLFLTVGSTAFSQGVRSTASCTFTGFFVTDTRFFTSGNVGFL
uniref:Uncharacterized protein n=1 Tax=Magallana gigas TaxID=29159 RepID=K1QC43_MAGGI